MGTRVSPTPRSAPAATDLEAVEDLEDPGDREEERRVSITGGSSLNIRASSVGHGQEHDRRQRHEARRP